MGAGVARGRPHLEEALRAGADALALVRVE